MRTICFYFQVHQPFRIKKNYRFFNIGNDHYYFDEFENRKIMRKVAEKCYLPTNNLMLELINKYQGKFKISYSLSGTFIDQMELYAPDVLDSFKALAATGCVEFLSETYSHSLASLKSKEEFFAQIDAHDEKIFKYFGQKPTAFRNTELIYSDHIGEMVAEKGFKVMLTEGAKHILGWKSPNFVYFNARNPKLKVLLKNFKLSDDIAFRFSNKNWAEWPLTVEKYKGWLDAIPHNEEIVNLFMDYETFGEHQWADTGVFEFMRALPEYVLRDPNYRFATPTETAEMYSPIAPVHVTHPISWADEERDLTAWLGNELQDEAFDKLYELKSVIDRIKDPKLQLDWKYLQTSDHFYYMCTKFFNDGDVHMYFNPYSSPYEAFINYMNVLSDFIIQIQRAEKTAHELSADELHDLLEQHKEEMKALQAKLAALQQNKEKVEAGNMAKPKVAAKKAAPVAKVEAKTAAKPAAKAKTGAKKKTE